MAPFVHGVHPGEPIPLTGGEYSDQATPRLNRNTRVKAALRQTLKDSHLDTHFYYVQKRAAASDVCSVPKNMTPERGPSLSTLNLSTFKIRWLFRIDSRTLCHAFIQPTVDPAWDLFSDGAPCFCCSRLTCMIFL